MNARASTPWASFLTVMVVSALFLAGCSGSGPGPDASDSSVVDQPSQGAEQGVTAEALPLLDGPMGSVATPAQPPADFSDRVLATGLDEATAFVLGQTKATVDVVDGHTVVVRSEFLNGATGEETYHLFSPATMDVGAAPEVTTEVKGDELHFTMTYAIDTASMPDGMLAQIDNGLPTAPPEQPAAAARGAAVTQAAVYRGGAAIRTGDNGSHTLGVFVDGVVSQAQETAGDTFVEAAGDALKASGKSGDKVPGASWNAYKAGSKVWDAVGVNDIVTKALDELDKLEKCAKNPTNPVTKKEYGDNPSSQQSAVDAVADARSEIKANAAVLFVSMMTDAASGLVNGAPWLGFIVTPAVNYTKDTLTDLIQENLDRARKAVVPCTTAYKISGGGGEFHGTGTVCDLSKPFTVSGSGVTVNFTPSDDTSGSYSYRGSMQGFSVFGEGTYTANANESGGTITATGPGTVRTPIGNRTAQGTENYTLTPIAPCQ